MGFLGSRRGLTPNLDALAKQSVVFTRAYAQVPLTPPSHASILTGTYPQFHHVNDMQTPLASDLPYAPEILHTRGYNTAAFVGAIVLQPEPPYAPGFDRGFDTYDAGYHSEGPGSERYTTVQRRGNEVVGHALAWLTKHPQGPFFIWIHLYDAHDPYDPPEPYKSRYVSAPYDGGVAYEDAAVGKFLRQLKLRGLYDGAIVAVTADHGESLGAHGEDTHGVFLYDETMHVPLLIKAAHSVTSKTIENRVELIDILPTLLQETGVAIPPEVQGQSLLALMPNAVTPGAANGDWHDRPAYAQSEYPRDFGWSALQALRWDRYLYVHAPRQELYDENADPKAEHNLAASSAAVADTLAGKLKTLRQNTSNTHEAPKPVLDLAAQAKLGAMGYMSSPTNALKTDRDDGPDPKDKIEIANMVHRAEVLQQDTNAEESIALLEQIIAKNPTNTLYIKLATWLMRNQDCPKAIPILRKALELDPASSGTHFLLGKCLLTTEQYAAAIPELENLIAKVPNAVEAHSFLELAYAQTNHLAEAIRECKVVLGYDPEDLGSYMILGQSLARSGDLQAGLTALNKAVTLQPEMPVAHLWLADIYDQMGRKEDAARERATAKQLGAPGPDGKQ